FREQGAVQDHARDTYPYAIVQYDEIVQLLGQTGIRSCDVGEVGVQERHLHRRPSRDGRVEAIYKLARRSRENFDVANAYNAAGSVMAHQTVSRGRRFSYFRELTQSSRSATQVVQL